MFGKSKESNSRVVNKRNQRRVIRNDITVAFEGKVGKKSYPLFVELLNISTKGMAFRCNKSMGVSSPLNLAFRFVDGKKFFMKGSVVHKMQESNSEQTGIKGAFQKMFKTDPSYFQYGINFEKADEDFQTTFIKTMLQKKEYIKNQYRVDYS